MRYRHLLMTFVGMAVLLLSFSYYGTAPALAQPGDLIISQYIEGSSNNKALEFFNGTGATIDLAAGNYVVASYHNGLATINAPTRAVSLTGTVADGDVYILADSLVTLPAITAQQDQNDVTSWFNGDDAIILWRGGVGGTIVDSFGQLGVDPGSEWNVGGVGTANETLTRIATVCAGDTTPGDAFDPSAEWTTAVQDNTDGLGSHSVTCTAADTAPTVTTTTPTNSATGVATNANIDINFSENVNFSAASFTLSGSTSGTIAGTFSGSGSSYTIDPSTDFAAGETITVTINAANVTDADSDDPPDNIVADYMFSFTVAAPVVFDFIHTIQGTGANVTGAGPFTVEAIVTADYQNNNQLSGFFIQEEDADADGNLATSEGIFVYCDTCPTNVAVGDLVQVTGTASDFFNMSQLTATTAGSVVVVSSGNTLPSPATINVGADLVTPLGNKDAFYEPFEGMRVTINDTLTVSEYFELFRYGQVVLYQGGRPYQYTHIDNTPTAGEYTTFQTDLIRRRLIIDDGSSTQNLPLSITPQVLFYPYPNGFGVGTQGTDYFRGGDTITNLTGVLHFAFSEWRIQPTQASYTFNAVNTRPTTPPNPGGNVRVASFNVLNYFTTIDTTSSNSSGPCGPSGTLDCRGADSGSELDRQTDKLVQALDAIDADVFGLVEIENNITTLSSLVTNLNVVAGAGTYDYVNVGTSVGTDAIMVAFIYQPGSVTPIGAPLIDNDSVHNRPPVAQLFEVTDAGNPDFGEQFIVVVNHFKSKGCGGASGADTDQGDGQGCYNATRTNQATRLNTWINTVVAPTYGDPDVLIIGDLNAYKGEDPISALTGAGYTDLVENFVGNNAYSYVFDGQLGYLDHALGNATMTAQVAGVVDWHINADEVPVFDYNDDIRDTGEASFEEEPDGNPLYQTNAFRTSDHDPVLIGLDLNSTIPVVTSAVEFNGTSLDGTTLNVAVDEMRITFNIPVFDDGTGADPDSASNSANYILLEEGTTAGFQSGTCFDIETSGVDAGDSLINQTGTTYVAGTNTTTLTFSPALTDGYYRLQICGTTSIVSGSNPPIELNNGADTVINFTIDTSIPTDPGTTPGGSQQPSQPELLGITELPATGETPSWRDDLMLVVALAGGLMLMGGAFFVLKQRS